MTLGQALWASINLQHLGTMEAPLEKFRSFPFVSFFFFSLCQPVRTHQTMAFGVILIKYLTETSFRRAHSPVLLAPATLLINFPN